MPETCLRRRRRAATP